ncbi:MAG: hypothetical protein JJE03_02900 [Peptostreptococcaceae bacterium]|nr:hypothetical protein [Peptostreptococcaceae bacterium]
MFNTKKAMDDYADRTELTAKEKKVIFEVYEECKKLKLKNFIGEVMIERVSEKDKSIPEMLVIEYAEELEAKDKK